MFTLEGALTSGFFADSLEMTLLGWFHLNLFDLLFVVTAIVFNLQIMGVIIARKHNQSDFVRLFGAATLVQALPLAVVVLHSLISGSESWILAGYLIIFFYLALELLADFIYKIEFRNKPILHIPYIILFYLVEFSFIAIAFEIGSASGTLVSLSFWALLLCLVYSWLPLESMLSWRGEQS